MFGIEPPNSNNMPARLDLSRNQQPEFNVYRVLAYTRPNYRHYIFVETEANGDGYASICKFVSGTPCFVHCHEMGLARTLDRQGHHLIGRVKRENYHGVESVVSQIDLSQTGPRGMEPHMGKVWADEAEMALARAGVVQPKPELARNIGEFD